MKFGLCAIAALAGLCTFEQAHADTNFDSVAWYVTAGYTREDSRQLDLNAIGGRIGARFGSYVGIEGEANFGLGHDRFVYAAPCSGPVCPLGPIFLDQAKLDNSEAIYAVGYLPITDDFDVFARVGYGNSNYSSGPVLSRGFNEQSFNFGGGAQYFVDGMNGIRVDYTREAVTNDDSVGREATGQAIGNWSLAFVHRF